MGELYEKTIAAVKAQIDYNILIMHNDKGLVDDIVITMADVMTIDRPYYVIRGDKVDTEIVWKHYEQINYQNLGIRILWRGLIDSELFDDLQEGNFEYIDIKDGEMLRLNAHGRIDRDKFEFRESYGLRWYDYNYMRDDISCGGGYLEDIKSVAAMYGEDPEVIQELYEQGFSLMELEEIVYCGR